MSEQSYLNSYRLLIGETTYEELSAKGSFLLPKNHEDPQVTLDYYISIEDYEKCRYYIQRNETDSVQRFSLSCDGGKNRKDADEFRNLRTAWC
jgi:hypothetical protein